VVKDWFESRSRSARQSGESVCDVDYFEAGCLPRWRVVELITEIEQNIWMQFSDADMHGSAFGTITGLTELILHARHRAVRAGNFKILCIRDWRALGNSGQKQLGCRRMFKTPTPFYPS